MTVKPTSLARFFDFAIAPLRMTVDCAMCHVERSEPSGERSRNILLVSAYVMYYSPCYKVVLFLPPTSLARFFDFAIAPLRMTVDCAMCHVARAKRCPRPVQERNDTKKIQGVMLSVVSRTANAVETSCSFPRMLCITRLIPRL